MDDKKTSSPRPAVPNLQGKLDKMWEQMHPPKPDDAVLLAEARRLLAAAPTREAFLAQDLRCAVWAGEGSALLQHHNSVRALEFRQRIGNIGGILDGQIGALPTALSILNEFRRTIELRGPGPAPQFAGTGQLYDYYQAVSSAMATAKGDLFITDRYLNAEFVGRFFPSLTRGIALRLLVRRPEKTLLPAIEVASAQYGVTTAVRAHDEVHDRYLFIDGGACHMSGSSFADGAKYAPTTLIPVTDFATLRDHYEALWAAGTVH